MSPLDRDISTWVRKLTGAKEFPVLALKIKAKINQQNRTGSEDSQHIFSYKSGKRDAVDDVFELILNEAIAPEEESELPEFADPFTE